MEELGLQVWGEQQERSLRRLQRPCTPAQGHSLGHSNVWWVWTFCLSVRGRRWMPQHRCQKYWLKPCQLGGCIVCKPQTLFSGYWKHKHCRRPDMRVIPAGHVIEAGGPRGVKVHVSHENTSSWKKNSSLSAALPMRGVYLVTAFLQFSNMLFDWNQMLNVTSSKRK